MTDANKIAQELYDYIELQFDEDPTYEMIRTGVERIAAALIEYGDQRAIEQLKVDQIYLDSERKKADIVLRDIEAQTEVKWHTYYQHKLAEADAAGYRRGVEEAIRVTKGYGDVGREIEKELQRGREDGK